MPILDPAHPLAKLLKTDKRYKFDAYLFVFESLNYAHEKMGMGEEAPAEEEPRRSAIVAAKRGKAAGTEAFDGPAIMRSGAPIRHRSSLA